MPKSTTTHGPPSALEGGDGVDEPVRADLARVVHPDRHAGADARARRRASRGRGSAPPSPSTPAAAAAPSRRGSRRRCRRTRGRAGRGGCAGGRRARRTSTRARSRSASRGRAPPRGTRPGGSGCSRRRRRAARGGIMLARADLRAPCHPGVPSVRDGRARAAAQGAAVPPRGADPRRRTRPQMRARFGETTVPGLEFPDGRRLTGSRAILRALEDHPPSLRARPTPTPGGSWSGRRSGATRCCSRWRAASSGPRSSAAPEVMDAYSAGADLPVPRAVARLSAPLVSRAARAANDGSDPNVRADLAHLAHHLDRVDRWIADGALGGAEPNAADLQVGSGLRAARLRRGPRGPSSRTGPRSPSRGAGSPATRRGACPRGRSRPSGSATSASSGSWAAWRRPRHPAVGGTESIVTRPRRECRRSTRQRRARRAARRRRPPAGRARRPRGRRPAP